jgi:hypothetical protein
MISAYLSAENILCERRVSGQRLIELTGKVNGSTQRKTADAAVSS